MAAAVRLREDCGADDLRGLAGKARDGAQARRLMARAAVADGKSRAEAAAVGLMDRQTLRDWGSASTPRVRRGSSTGGRRAGRRS